MSKKPPPDQDPAEKEQKVRADARVLVLGPGGPKGFAELGSISYLLSHGMLDKIDTIVGISVGALIGLLYICGYKPFDIAALTYKSNAFGDISSIDITQLDKSFGIFSNETIKEILTEMIRKKFGFIPTLNQLYFATGIKLVVVTHNISTHQTVHISHETHADLNCIHAVLLSMNIPFLLHKMTYNGEAYIDGAFGDAYPIEKYDDGNTCIIGIYPVTAGSETGSKSLTNYVTDVFMSPQFEKYQMSCSKCTAAVTNIKLNVDFTNADWILPENRLKMFVQGWMQTHEFFNHIVLSGKHLKGLR